MCVLIMAYGLLVHVVIGLVVWLCHCGSLWVYGMVMALLCMVCLESFAMNPLWALLVRV